LMPWPRAASLPARPSWRRLQSWARTGSRWGPEGTSAATARCSTDDGSVNCRANLFVTQQFPLQISVAEEIKNKYKSAELFEI
ncbi:hypothetical protein BAE44_0024505, partial [Dichanthelium oligosanthes]